MSSPNAAPNIVPFPDLRVVHTPSTEIPHYVGTPRTPTTTRGGDGETPDTERLRGELDRDLAALGVCYRRRIFRLFYLEEIAEALVEVQDARQDGRVYNAAGLFIRVLEGNTGRSVFR